MIVKSNSPAPVAELADALDLGSSGRPWGFKSLQAHHKKLLEEEFFAALKEGLEFERAGRSAGPSRAGHFPKCAERRIHTSNR